MDFYETTVGKVVDIPHCALSILDKRRNQPSCLTKNNQRYQ